MKRTEYAINGSAGAVTNIPATQATRYVEVTEVNTAAKPAQGLDYQTPDDAFTATHSLSPADTLVLGDKVGVQKGVGHMLGLPAQGDAGKFNARSADTLVQLRSTSATATRVLVVEYD